MEQIYLDVVNLVHHTDWKQGEAASLALSKAP